MRKLLLPLLLGCLFAVGCSDINIGIGTKPSKPVENVFTVDGEGDYVVEAVGGNVLVKVTTNIEYDVVIPAEVSWLSLSDTRAVREETLTIVVAKNDEFNERSAKILLVNSNEGNLYEFTITQKFDEVNVPNNQIWYLATSAIELNAEADFGANILSHDFTDGRGVITFDSAVTKIANQAFVKCEELTLIALPQSVESVAEGCFAECNNLERFVGDFATLDNRALVVDEVMVAFAPKGLTSYTTPRDIKRIGEYTFAYCMELVNVTIDYNTEVVGAWSFTHCEELVNAHIADSVTTIEAGAFSYCYKLGMSGAYTVKDGFIMHDGAVVGSTGECGDGVLIIPSEVITIGSGAFKNYSSISEVVIPASVTEIYAWAFVGCENLVRVVCEPVVPPTAVFVEDVWQAFDDNAKDRKIYVPVESVDAYKSAIGWRDYADAIVGYGNGASDTVGIMAVDLGLSVKWSSYNVGANAPEECGDYFAWGEIAPKEVYTLDNCLTNGLKLDDISGNPQYDAAAANWGGDWRVPTIAEFQELIDDCTWESVCLNDMQGMQVTGPNGNSIFLPAAGTCPDGSPTSVGVCGYYWSSTPYEEGKTSAYAINFLGEHRDSYWIGRYNSLSIRPVID